MRLFEIQNCILLVGICIFKLFHDVSIEFSRKHGHFFDKKGEEMEERAFLTEIVKFIGIYALFRNFRV